MREGIYGKDFNDLSCLVWPRFFYLRTATESTAGFIPSIIPQGNAMHGLPFF